MHNGQVSLSGKVSCWELVQLQQCIEEALERAGSVVEDAAACSYVIQRVPVDNRYAWNIVVCLPEL